MTSQPLISPTELQRIEARVKALHRGPLSVPGAQLSGPQQTHHRGAGMELQDLRGYEHGDEVRHIAWRSSARAGRPLVKVFQAERLARRLLVVEQHGGMYFASRGELKAALAVRICALLGFSALNQQSEVGGLTFSDGERFFPYSRRQARLLALLASINLADAPTREAEPEAVTAQLQRLARGRSEIYLISDFSHWQADHLRALAPLGQRATLHAIEIFDEGEQQLTDMGRVKIASPYGDGVAVIDTGDARLRARYNQQMAARRALIATEFKRAGIRHLCCASHDDPLHTLGPLL